MPVDGIYIYGTEVLTLGLLWLGFNDAIKEGDGDKVFVYWKFLLLVFKRGGCRNYAIEAVNLLYQTHTLSPRLVAQLKWGRFINTHGRQGCNIAGDLHLEHLNKRLKGILHNLGPNNNTDTIQRAAKWSARCANNLKGRRVLLKTVITTNGSHTKKIST